MKKIWVGVILSVFLLFPLLVSAVDISVKYSDVICSPNKDFCDSSHPGELLKCGEFGDESQVIDICGDKEICARDVRTNEFKCMNKKDISTGTDAEDGRNNNGFLMGLLILGIIAIFTTVIYSLVKNMDKKK